MRKINYEQYEGKIFGYLTFIKALPFDGRRRKILALCKCGKQVFIDWDNLRTGKSKSCGCKMKECLVGRDHPLYKIWQNIKDRCNNPKSKMYKYYGGRGVVICKEWNDSYDVFYKWCLSSGWEVGLDLDKDKVGSGFLYSPKTCCFITHAENMGSTRNAKLTEQTANEIRRSTESAKQLSKKYKVSTNLIWCVKRGKSWKR